MRFVHRSPGNPEDVARFGTLAIQEGEVFLVAVAEDGMASGAPGAAARILTSAAGVLMQAEKQLTPHWPALLASQVTDQLRLKERDAPAWLLFAAVLISPSAIHVCTAGDIRVHLICGGRVARVTRDHILANESPDWVRTTYGDLPPGDHDTIITRTLGNCSLPPEADAWQAQTPFSLLICSSAYHRHRLPDTYAAEIFEAPSRDEDAEGALARIDV